MHLVDFVVETLPVALVEATMAGTMDMVVATTMALLTISTAVTVSLVRINGKLHKMP